MKVHTDEINPRILPTMVSIVTIFNPEEGLGAAPGKSSTSLVVVDSVIIVSFFVQVKTFVQ
jgi:hypothetical protein